MASEIVWKYRPTPLFVLLLLPDFLPPAVDDDADDADALRFFAIRSRISPRKSAHPITLALLQSSLVDQQQQHN
jgi:hypothetical protein